LFGLLIKYCLVLVKYLVNCKTNVCIYFLIQNNNFILHIVLHKKNIHNMKTTLYFTEAPLSLNTYRIVAITMLLLFPNIVKAQNNTPPSGDCDCGLYKGSNLVTNGDFENGNTGFNSDYTINSTAARGRYSIEYNSRDWNAGLKTEDDHTFGPDLNPNDQIGLFMVADGHSGTNMQRIWYQNVSVVSNETYDFVVWASNANANTYTSNRATLNVRSNKQTLFSQNFTLPIMSPTGEEWVRLCAEWLSNFTGTVEISIDVTPSNGGGSDFGLDDISFFKRPDPAGPDRLICIGDTTVLGGVYCPDAAVGITTFNWSPLYNISSQTESNPYVFPETSFDYYVSVFNGNCVLLDTVKVSVFQLAPYVEPSTNSPPGSPICEGDQLQLFANMTNKSGITFEWTGPNGFTSTQKDPVINDAVPGNSGIYVVRAYNGPCKGDSNTVEVLILLGPNADFIYNTEDICDGGLTKFVSLDQNSNHDWIIRNSNQTVVFSSNETSPTAELLNGTYAISHNVTASNGCSDAKLTNMTLTDVYDVISYTSTTKGIWQNKGANPFGKDQINVKNDIIISHNITIKNLDFNFGEEGKLVVKSRNKLIIDNSSFDEFVACSKNWVGIQVEGAFHPFDSVNDEGQIEVNDGEISNAKIGIATIGHDIDNFAHVGFVKVLQASEFNDNYISIQIIEIPSNQNRRDIHKIENSVINWTDDYHYFDGCAYSPKAMVDIRFVGSVYFKNMEFNGNIDNPRGNTSQVTCLTKDGSNSDGPAFYGIGVATYNSDIDFNHSFIGTTSYFSNLDFGISQNWGTGTNTSGTSIQNTEYRNVGRGISVTGIRQPLINSNKFYASSTSRLCVPGNPCPVSYLVGIHANGTRGVSIVYNGFYRQNEGVNGIHLSSNNVEANIKTNRFEQCGIGIYNYLYNKTLEVDCNVFENGKIINWSILNSTIQNQGQGSCKSPTSNIFYSPVTTSVVDISAINSSNSNEAKNPIVYFHYNQAASNVDGNPEPTTAGNSILLEPCFGGFLDYTNNCGEGVNKNGETVSNEFESWTVVETIQEINSLAISDIDFAEITMQDYISFKINSNTDFNNSDLVNLLEDVNLTLAKVELAGYYATINKFDSTQNILSALPIDDEIQTSIDYYTILGKYQQQGLSLFEMEASDIANLNVIALMDNSISYLAKAVLQYYFGYDYYISPNTQVVVQDKRNIDSILITKIKVDYISSVYPNPVKSKFSVDFDLSKSMEATISVFNTYGQLIDTENVQGVGIFNMDLERFTTGIYYIKMVNTSNEILLNQKISKN
jgi:hypothetical protein